MKKVLSLTLAISLMSNVVFANGNSSDQISAALNQMDQSAIELQTQDEILKMENQIVSLRGEIKDLQRSIWLHLEHREFIGKHTALFGTLSVGLSLIIRNANKALKIAKVESTVGGTEVMTGFFTGLFAGFSLSGLANEFILFETREELVEFQQLLNEVETKLKAEQEAIQNM